MWIKDTRAGQEVLQLTGGVFGMNARAAGSGSEGLVFHGRLGDGFTLSLHMVIPDRHGARMTDNETTAENCFFKGQLKGNKQPDNYT